MRGVRLEAGNRALKWALSGSDEPSPLARGILVLEGGFTDELAGTMKAALANLPSRSAAGLQAVGCSVASEAVTRAVAAAVAPLASGGVRWLTSEARFEHRGVVLVNGYRNPSQLGADRWYAMIA